MLFLYFSMILITLISAPPSYEESMFRCDTLRDHGDSEHVMGAQEPFAPRYTVYRFPTNPQ